MVHTIFNIGTTVLLFPASNWIIRLAKKLGRVKEGEQEKEHGAFGRNVFWKRQHRTAGQRSKEIDRMGKIVEESLLVAKNVLFAPKEQDIRFLREEEKTVDRLCRPENHRDYAIKLSSLQISEKEHQEISHLLQIVSGYGTGQRLL
ncbi:hypothetical protein [Suipraeoptans intestinalis]|uniref:hypothetical protein n=1 Tax=Suipraeoptans intestinalis TaxID=2606628 RepID=UPI001562EC2F